MLGEIFGPDLLIVVLIGVVVLFGGAAIPKLARNLGSAKKEFEKGVHVGPSSQDQSGASDAGTAGAAGPAGPPGSAGPVG